ncbi:MAG: DUF1572 family protein [Terriglobales bacterium]
MAHEFTTSYIADSLALFRQWKNLADKAMAQVSDDEFHRSIDPESNSIALIVKHLAGNMRSRWEDFLTTDGEKPDRHRDTEFEMPERLTREQVFAMWERGWRYVFDALEPLTDADVNRTVFIRGEPHSVMQAINRQVAHYANHIGQIIFLAKHFRSSEWKPVTIPRGKSEEFLRRVKSGEASQR